MQYWDLTKLHTVGGIFTAQTGSVAHGTALSTAPPIALHNPASSKVELVLLEAGYGFVSGTLGNGHFQFAYAAQPSAPTGGTALTARPQPIGSAAVAVGKAYQGSTIVTPTALRPACGLVSTNAIPAPTNPGIVICPGQVLSMEGVASPGTSPLVVAYFVWAEYRVG